jgi:hypothetical protein
MGSSYAPRCVKRRPYQNHNRPRHDRLFEEPTYLVLVNVRLAKRFQYELRRRAPGERDAGEPPDQARPAPRHTSKTVFRLRETQPYGSNVAR